MKNEPMNIVVRPLSTLDGFRRCEALQEQLRGDHASSVWSVAQLAQIHESGGLLLGAWAADHPDRLLGALVDLVAEIDGYPARETVFLGIETTEHGQGIAELLRTHERAILRKLGVDLCFWDTDPLRSPDLHLALDTLGAIATGHIRNALGVLRDAANEGLATDRLRVEWWLDAPRVVAHLDQGRALSHQEMRLHEMAVLTHSSIASSGVRKLTRIDGPPTERVVLVEIPEDLDRIRYTDADLAADWRLQTRELLDDMFKRGYVGVGLIHQGERSFLIFESGSRRSVLAA